MVTFALSKSVWEFIKLHAIRAMRDSVVYVPTWQHPNVQNACKRLIFRCQGANKLANVPKVCQLFNLACQRAKSLLIFQLNVPTCQMACQCFILACQHARRRTKFSNIPLTKC